MAEVAAHIAPGVTTDELDRVGHAFLLDHGAYPSTLGYRGFPKSLCTSVNEVICHGIPDSTVLQDREHRQAEADRNPTKLNDGRCVERGLLEASASTVAFSAAPRAINESAARPSANALVAAAWPAIARLNSTSCCVS